MTLPEAIRDARGLSWTQHEPIHVYRDVDFGVFFTACERAARDIETLRLSYVERVCTIRSYASM